MNAHLEEAERSAEDGGPRVVTWEKKSAHEIEVGRLKKRLRNTQQRNAYLEEWLGNRLTKGREAMLIKQNAALQERLRLADLDIARLRSKLTNDVQDTAAELRKRVALALNEALGKDLRR